MRKLGPRYCGHDQLVFACKVIEVILADADLVEKPSRPAVAGGP